MSPNGMAEMNVLAAITGLVTYPLIRVVASVGRVINTLTLSARYFFLASYYDIRSAFRHRRILRGLAEIFIAPTRALSWVLAGLVITTLYEAAVCIISPFRAAFVGWNGGFTGIFQAQELLDEEGGSDKKTVLNQQLTVMGLKQEIEDAFFVEKSLDLFRGKPLYDYTSRFMTSLRQPNSYRYAKVSKEEHIELEEVDVQRLLEEASTSLLTENELEVLNKRYSPYFDRTESTLKYNEIR